MLYKIYQEIYIHVYVYNLKIMKSIIQTKSQQIFTSIRNFLIIIFLFALFTHYKKIYLQRL